MALQKALKINRFLSLRLCVRRETVQTFINYILKQFLSITRKTDVPNTVNIINISFIGFFLELGAVSF